MRPPPDDERGAGHSARAARTLAITTRETRRRWISDRRAAPAAEVAEAARAIERSLEAARAAYVGCRGYWIRAESKGSEADIGVGHRMYGGRALARLRVRAPQGTEAQAQASIVGLLSQSALAGSAAMIASELEAIQRALAWAWIER